MYIYHREREGRPLLPWGAGRGPPPLQEATLGARRAPSQAPIPGRHRSRLRERYTSKRCIRYDTRPIRYQNNASHCIASHPSCSIQSNHITSMRCSDHVPCLVCSRVRVLWIPRCVPEVWYKIMRCEATRQDRVAEQCRVISKHICTYRCSSLPAEKVALLDSALPATQLNPRLPKTRRV